MPLKIVLWRPQNLSRLKPYYKSTITAVKIHVSKKDLPYLNSVLTKWGFL